MADPMFGKQVSSSTLAEGISEIVEQSSRFLASRSDDDLEREIQKLEAGWRPVYVVGRFLD